jgi:hypothetical protein
MKGDFFISMLVVASYVPQLIKDDASHDVPY